MGNKGRPSPKDTRAPSSTGAAASDKVDSGGGGTAGKGNSGMVNKKGLVGTGKSSHKGSAGGAKAGAGKKGEQGKRSHAAQRGANQPRLTLNALQPVKQLSHWDYLMTEMKWMATDFMQERRWKMAAGAHFSRLIVESGKVQVEAGVAGEEREAGKPSENGITEAVPSTSGKKDASDGDVTVKAGADAAAGKEDAGAAVGGKEQGAEEADPDGPGTPVKASEASSWCLHYHCSADVKKAFLAHVYEMDDQRALAQDLRYQEYVLDYEAACASVALAHEVAKIEAARLAAEQLREAERARLEAEEQIKNNKRLKKKTSKALDGLDIGEDDSPLLGSLVGTPRTESVDLDTPQQRKKEKKRKKKGEEDAESLDLGAGIKRSAVVMEAGTKGQERKAAKKAKGQKAAESAPNETLSKNRAKKTTIMPGDLIAWTPQEDQLLLAIVHEFGANWVLVADVLSSGSALQGVYRRPDQCKSRYKALNQQNQDASGTESAFSSQKLTKGAAREVLSSAMPVPELVLNRQITNLARVSLRLVSTLEEERKRKFEANGQRHVIHASHGSIEMKCMQANGNKLMTPLELAELANQIIPPESNSLIMSATMHPPSALQTAALGQQHLQVAPLGAAPSGQLQQQTGHMAAHPTAGSLQSSQAVQSLQGGSVAGLASATHQLLPQVSAPQPLQVQPGVASTAQPLLPGSAPTTASVQATVQARNAQIQAQVAKVAQQKGLTAQQQAELLVQLQQRVNNPQLQQHQQQLQPQQQGLPGSQGMSAGFGGQAMQMASQPVGITPQVLQAQQQGAMLMQRVSSAQHMVPGQQQQLLMTSQPSSGALAQTMGGMSLPMQHPGMMQQQPHMMAGQLQQQPQMSVNAPVSMGQGGSAQMQALQHVGALTGNQQPNAGGPQPPAGA